MKELGFGLEKAGRSAGMNLSSKISSPIRGADGSRDTLSNCLNSVPALAQVSQSTHGIMRKPGTPGSINFAAGHERPAVYRTEKEASL